ncbi:MAG: hypothetical protein P8X42_03010, partial [Calditrichaceae bacterium]
NSESKADILADSLGAGYIKNNAFFDDAIHMIPSRGIRGILSANASISMEQYGDGFQIRWGDFNDHSVFLDGILLNNPIDNGLSFYFPNELFQSVSVQAGALDAEYANVISGAVNLNTLERSDRYFGSVQTYTDELLSAEDKNPGGYSFGYNEYNLITGGPLIKGKPHNFLISATRRWLADQSPSWGWTENHNKPSGFSEGRIPANHLSQWNFFARLKYYVTDNLSLTGHWITASRDRSNIETQWFYDTEHAPWQTTNNDVYHIGLAYNFNKSGSINLNGFHIAEFNEFYDRYFKNDLYKYGNPEYNPYDAEDMNNWATVYFDRNSQLEPDYFDPGHQYNYYLKNKAEQTGFNIDLLNKIKQHRLKTGFRYQYHTIREYKVNQPVELALKYSPQYSELGINDYDLYRLADIRFYGYDINGKEVDEGSFFDVVRDSASHDPVSGYTKQAPYHPKTATAYIQDDFKFGDISIGVGFNLNYFDPNTWQFKNLDEELKNINNTPGAYDPIDLFSDNNLLDKTDTQEADVHYTFNHRFALNYCFKDSYNLFIDWGTYSKNPDFNSTYPSPFYLDRWPREGLYLPTLNNSGLRPRKSNNIQVGTRIKLNQYIEIKGEYYGRETKDIPNTVSVHAYFGGMWVYKNESTSNVRGIKLGISLNRYKHIAANLTYEYQNIESSLLLKNYNMHLIRLLTDIRLYENEGPKFFGIYFLQNTTTSFLYQFNSPLPEVGASTIHLIDFEPYRVFWTSIPKQNTKRIDLKIEKKFDLFLNSYISFSVSILNVFNTKNVIRVWPPSGQPDNTGYLLTPAGQEYYSDLNEDQQKQYLMREMEFKHYGMPRQIRFGVTIGF